MVKFNKELSKKERRKLEEQQVAKEEPVEAEEKLEAKLEEEPEAAEEAKPEEEAKTKELYETEKGEAVLEYEKSPEKKGYCELRERAKEVYGIKYAAVKAVDLVKKAKAAILDWSFIMHKKGPQRKEEEELL